MMLQFRKMLTPSISEYLSKTNLTTSTAHMILKKPPDKNQKDKTKSLQKLPLY